MKHQIEFLATDTNTQDDRKIEWYNVDGEVWGLVTNLSTNKQSLVDEDGCPVNLDGFDGLGARILELLTSPQVETENATEQQ